ncbi:hypothetical protein [Calothrix sp. CCY 0018]|uniref:hypothetical protein n=1 Tax=Calothrix sp. CCY 0018 TaxID=3103864 RepID=UPI0039C5FF49
MSKYQQIINRFLTGISLRDNFRGTASVLTQQETHRGLKPFLENLIEDSCGASEDELAQYFLQFLLEARKSYYFLWSHQANLAVTFSYTICYKLAKLCLFNYLQLICFYAARDVSQKLKLTSNSGSYYALEDCFIMGVEIALAPAYLLRGYSFESQTALQSYASVALNRTIKNKIVGELKTKSLKYSDNGLLRNTTKSKLEQALTNFGISKSNLIKYSLVWQAFNELFLELYPPSSDGSDGSHHRKPPTTALTNEQLDLIAIRYNKQIRRLEIEDTLSDRQTIKQMLATCVEAVRNLQSKRLVSIEEHNYINEIAAESTNELIEEETQQQSKEVRNIILKEFQGLEKSEQKSLLLWLGLEINQNDFLEILNLEKQYQVARYFQRSIKTILKAFIKRYSDISEKKLGAREIDRLCKDKLNDVKGYLSIHSKNFFRQILAKTFLNKINESDKLNLIPYLDTLNEYNQQRIKNMDIRDSLADAYIKAKNSIVKIQQPFSVEVEDKLEIKLQQFNSAVEKVESFIENWLVANQAALYQNQNQNQKVEA